MSEDEGRNVLADELARKGYIRTTAVEGAFRAVPRHLFIPEAAPDLAYRDEAVSVETPEGMAESSASQPSIVAKMLEQSGVESGDRVLEVGTATGYNAALLSRLTGEEGRVVTVEINESLALRARRSLSAAGFSRVEVVCADGSSGHPEEAPYDRIIVTTGAPDIALAWREQLAPGGRLVLPLELWPGLQVCIAFEPSGDHLASVAAAWCGFLRMGGELAGAEEEIERPDERPVDEASLEARLRVLRDVHLVSGSPFPEWFRMRAYRRDSAPVPDSEELVIEKKLSRLALDQL